MTTTEKTGVLAMTVIVIIILAVVMTSGRAESPLTPQGANAKIQDALGQRDASHATPAEDRSLNLTKRELDERFGPDTKRRSAPIPQPKPKPAVDVDPKPAPKPAVDPKSTVREYTIQPNDILGEIAMRELGTSRRWREILELNPKLDPKRMRPGTVIKLPARRRLKP